MLLDSKCSDIRYIDDLTHVQVIGIPDRGYMSLNN